MDNELRINIPDSLSAMAFAVAGQQKTIDFLREQLDQEIAQRKVSEAVTKEYEEEKMQLQREKAQLAKDLIDIQNALKLKEPEFVNEQQALAASEEEAVQLTKDINELEGKLIELTAWTKVEGDIPPVGLMLVICRNYSPCKYYTSAQSVIEPGSIGMDIGSINENGAKDFCLNYDYLTPLYYRPLITKYDWEQLQEVIDGNGTIKEQP